MVQFTETLDGAYVAEGHDLAEVDLRAGLEVALTANRPAGQAKADAAAATISEGWHSGKHGFGHDCAQHQEVDQGLWAPGCFDGGFRPVTAATGVRIPETVNREPSRAAVTAEGAADATGGEQPA